MTPKRECRVKNEAARNKEILKKKRKIDEIDEYIFLGIKIEKYWGKGRRRELLIQILRDLLTIFAFVSPDW